MIKINLLPARRQKSRASAPDESSRPLMIGIVSLVAIGAAVAMLVDRPKRAKLAELAEANAQLQNEINAKNRQLAGYAELKKAAEEADERFKSIQVTAGVAGANDGFHLAFGQKLPASTNRIVRLLA